MRAPGGHGERGSAAVLVVAATGVVVTLAAAALVVTGIVRDVHRAGSAADLAALAAAAPMAAGAPPDCDAARQVARANGAGLTECEPQGGATVVVAVAITRPTSAGWLRGPAAVVGRARAGVVE